MAAIVYLDVDDEITSAASRIRGATDKRVGLVVPYGSRLATSRINFRLLAREAQGRGRKLSIVAGDAATRALAVSAGLPAFSSVGEYEVAESAPRSRTSAASAASAAAAATPPGADAAAPPKTGNGARRKAPSPAAPAVDADVEPTGLMPAIAATAARIIGGTPAEAERRPAISVPMDRPRRRIAWPFGRTAAIAVVGVIALALLATGVAGYLLLPSADVTIATRTETIGPVPLEIRADPNVIVLDPETGTVPAQRLTFDVTVSGTFPTTGKRIIRNPAAGQVTFENYDPTSRKSIAGGSIVSTEGGIQFRTNGAVDVPAGTFVLPEVVPGRVNVGVQAVEAGPAGNVPANAINVIPQGENPTFLRVHNAEPTAGGRRREFPRIAQEDLDAALAGLGTRLGEEFTTLLADPARTPPNLTLFPATALLGNALPTTDPATLLNQEVTEFTLGLAAPGTAIAVDLSPLEAIARTRIANSVDEGYRLVEGSIQVASGTPFVAGETVTFPVSASAEQIRLLDAEALRAEIMGKSVAQARALLERYGSVELTVWPDWVTSISTFDGRVTLRIEAPSESGPAPTPSPRASGSPDASPVASPIASPAASEAPSPAGSQDSPLPSASQEAGPVGEVPTP